MHKDNLHHKWSACYRFIFKAELVVSMLSQLYYTLAKDGSNEAGISKMNLLTVRLYNSWHGLIVTQLKIVIRHVSENQSIIEWT